ncbi:MAG: hydrogenase maturation nickel metallochaperone HypA, partial [Granulosicoccaceae bacterium]
MHEMSLCESIVQTLDEQASQQQFQRVKRVWLVVGQLACVEPEALQFCFSVVCKNTLAEGSELLIEREQADAWCMQCCAPVEIQSRESACP